MNDSYHPVYAGEESKTAAPPAPHLQPLKSVSQVSLHLHCCLSSGVSHPCLSNHNRLLIGPLPLVPAVGPDLSLAHTAHLCPVCPSLALQLNSFLFLSCVLCRPPQFLPLACFCPSLGLSSAIFRSVGQPSPPPGSSPCPSPLQTGIGTYPICFPIPCASPKLYLITLHHPLRAGQGHIHLAFCQSTLQGPAGRLVKPLRHPQCEGLWWDRG